MKNCPIPSASGEDGYAKAFYEIANMLGIPAQADSPRHVWESVMRPRILAALRPALVDEGQNRWAPARNLFVTYAERFTNATRYEEASAIADKAAREFDALYATPASQDALIARDGCEMPEVVMARYIEILRSDEGDSVTICCDDPEANEREKQVAIDCCAWWTDWNERRFYGESVLQCLAKAVQVRALLADRNAGAARECSVEPSDGGRDAA